MNKHVNGSALASLAAITLIGLLGFGCASPNVNPPKPRANTGYIDLGTASEDDVAWQVERFDPAANRFKTVFSELDPVPDGILRLAFPPGSQRLRLAFLNRVLVAPAVVEVTVQDGQITPVQVTLTEAGATSVENKEVRWGTTVYGRRGRSTKFSATETKAFSATAVAQAPRPYQPKPPISQVQSSTK